MSEPRTPPPAFDAGQAHTPSWAEPTGAGLPIAPLRWDSQQLLQGHPQIEIAHGDALYRLRQTASGKLILTK